MRSELIVRYGLWIGGGVIFMIGLGHIFMPGLGYPANVTDGWSAAALDHFYYLATYSICGFLLAIGALSFLHGAGVVTRLTAWFASIMSALWALRLMLEIKYPVAIPIYFVEQPHAPIVAAITIATFAYLASAIAAWRCLLRNEA